MGELAGAGAVIVAAGVVFVRALISINRRVNDHAERLARLEGETHPNGRRD